MRENSIASDVRAEENRCVGTDDGNKITFTYEGNAFYGDIEQVNGKIRVSGQEIVAYHDDRQAAVELFMAAVMGMVNDTIELGILH